MSNKYPEHANSDERRCAKLLVDTILEKGYRIAVKHCEGVELKAGRNQKSLDVRKAMSHTGTDNLIVYGQGRGEVLGNFFLIYDNGSEDEPMILIADYSANDTCEEIYSAVDRVLG